MANLYLVWDIKARDVASIHESSADATAALRKHLTKSGAIANQKLSARQSADFEVITVTR